MQRPWNRRNGKRPEIRRGATAWRRMTGSGRATPFSIASDRDKSENPGNMAALDLRISPKTVQQQIVEKLRGAIIEGMFKPGDRLVEANLCEMLGVSRPSIRE